MRLTGGVVSSFSLLPPRQTHSPTPCPGRPTHLPLAQADPLTYPRPGAAALWGRLVLCSPTSPFFIFKTRSTASTSLFYKTEQPTFRFRPISFNQSFSDWVPSLLSTADTQPCGGGVDWLRHSLALSTDLAPLVFPLFPSYFLNLTLYPSYLVVFALFLVNFAPVIPKSFSLVF